MSRVSLLYGEQGLLDEYNNHVDEKLNKKSSKTKRQSTSSVGFTRGIGQMIQDILTYDPHSSYFHLPIGGLFDTKEHFYRVISLLLTNLGLVFDIRSPSPWQVISELQNRDIIGKSDSANLKVCLSIANEIRLKAYFANGGQKELFSPLLQSPDTAEQSTDDPIFRDFDEDTLVCLLSNSYDMHRRCEEFCLKYLEEDEVDASILRKPFPYSKDLLMSCLYFRLEKFSKGLECIKSIPKDSPEYATCLGIRGQHHAFKNEHKKAIECFEAALEYSQDPHDSLSFHHRLVRSLRHCHEFKKAKYMLEKAMKLHDEIYGEGFETRISIELMLDLDSIDYALDEISSDSEGYQRLKQMHERMTECSDITTTDIVNLHIQMALWCSRFCQNDQSLDYLERALRLGHEIFDERDLSSELLKMYKNAAIIYKKCGRHHEASVMRERCLKLTESLYHGDTPHPDKIDSLTELGELFLQRNQIDRAVKSLESALEQAKKVYPGQPQVVIMLCGLGEAAYRDGKPEQSLRYLKEANEIWDNHIEVEYPNVCVLNNIGKCYDLLDKCLLAFQSYKDALDVMIISDNICNILFGNMANTVTRLSCVNNDQFTMLLESDEDEAFETHEAFEIDGETYMSSIKDTYPVLVNKLYHSSLFCKYKTKQDEMLKHLEKARDIAKRFDYKCGRVVLVLLLLSMTYGEKRSFDKWKSYYKEAKGMAKSLPPEDDSIRPEELGMIEWMKKE